LTTEGAALRHKAKPQHDVETGNYYYGARYYNPMVSVWLGVDPLAHKYPHMSSYVFTGNNPVMLVDPDGMRIVWSVDAVRVGFSMMFSKKGRENWRAMRKDKFVDFEFRISNSVGMSRGADGEWGVVEGHMHQKENSECTMVTVIYKGTHKLKKEAEKRNKKDWHEIDSDYQYSFIRARVQNAGKNIELIEDSGESTGNLHSMDDSYTREAYRSGKERCYHNTSRKGESAFRYIGRLGRHETTHALVNSGVWEDPYPSDPERFPQERE
jgi:RHS repeat-associated protein